MNHDDAFLRACTAWLLCACLVFFIVDYAFGRRWRSSISGYVSSAGLDPGDVARLERVVAVRERLEAAPRLVRWIEPPAFLALLAIDVYTRTPVPVLLSLTYAAIAVTVYLNVAGVRAAGRRRVASMRVRNPFALVPQYAFVLSACVALLPLLRVRAEPVTALVLATASLTAWASAFSMARLPPALPGDDAVVEQFVDERVRFERAFMLLAVIPVPAWMFFLLSPYVPSPWFLSTDVLNLVVFFWMIVLAVVQWIAKRRYIRRARLEGWPAMHG